MSDYFIKISTPADLSGATDIAVAALEKLAQQTGGVTVPATDAAGAPDRLARAAARTPDATLESLAASARQVEANAAASRQPLADLAGEPADFLEQIAAGFGQDAGGTTLVGVEDIGQASATMASGNSRGDASPTPTPGNPAGEEGKAAGHENEQADLLAARARGEDAVADKLARQRDLRLESRRLQNQEIHSARAGAAAPDRTGPRPAGNSRPEAEHHTGQPRHAPREHARRRGGHGRFTIHGYSDPDEGGGLHTGGLATGHLEDSGGSSAADALAAAPTRVPAFPPEPRDPPFPAVAPAPPLFGVPTAAAQLGPVVGGTAGPGPVAAAAPPDGKAGVDTQAATAAAASAAREATDTAKSFGEFTRAFGTFSAAFQQLQRDVDSLKGQVSNRS